MIKLGNSKIRLVYVGNSKIQQAYVSNSLVYNAIVKYTISVGITSGQSTFGTVSGGGVFEEGSSVTVVAIANDGYRFVEWLENGVSVSTDSEYTFVIGSNRNLVAVFEVHVKELVYYGTISPFTKNVSAFGAASTDTYAMFGGGYGSTNSTATGQVNFYDKQLTRTYKAVLYSRWIEDGAAGLEKKVYFAGGRTKKGTPYTPTVESVDNSLTKTAVTSLSSYRTPAGASIGDLAIFAGGHVYQSSSSTGVSSAVEAYNSAGEKTTPADVLSIYRFNLRGTTVGNYVIFGGGSISTTTTNYKKEVDAYNESLTRVIPSVLMSQARASYGAATTGNYAIFAGGSHGTATASQDAIVDVYNDKLIHNTPVKKLAIGRQIAGYFSLGKYAVFAGGYTYIGSTSKNYDIVEAYNEELTYLTPKVLSTARNVRATSIGDYGLIPDYINGNVDVYELK